MTADFRRHLFAHDHPRIAELRGMGAYLPYGLDGLSPAPDGEPAPMALVRPWPVSAARPARPEPVPTEV